MPSSPSSRFGVTIPFEGIGLAEHGPLLHELVELGYTDLWTAEVDGTDGFTPLAMAAAWEPTPHLGLALAPAYTRGPALLAQTAAAMAEAAPGRFVLGLGASSPVIVGDWNGIPFEKPYARVRDTLRFLRAALAGQKVTERFETFSVKGFRLARPPAAPPPLYLGALRPGMLRLAGAEADGVILNWLSPDDVPTALAEVGTPKEVVARIFVVPNPDQQVARAVARRLIAAYLNVPAYAAFQRWLGRADRLEPMWKAWAAGDRQGALAALDDGVVDDLVVHGSPERCRTIVERYVQMGVTVPVVMAIPVGVDLAASLRAMSPRR